MMKTLRKKFIFFAMSAVTILLAVLIGAINGLSWMTLDRQSSFVLHTIVNRDERFLQNEFHDPKPFAPPMDLDTIKSARFFTVRTDQSGNVVDVNLDQISSVDMKKAALYAGQITGTFGKIDGYKYEVKQLDTGQLIFFMDISGQFRIFILVLSISFMIALICWIASWLFVILFSGRVVYCVVVFFFFFFWRCVSQFF